ncbi:hypothetical protein D5086_013552 [Populus alba]|uniref:Uncharacterized protein n=1 Tax=Populus alba TaxID=43335 RepID=A0ACC4C6W2_POPAL
MCTNISRSYRRKAAGQAQIEETISNFLSCGWMRHKLLSSCYYTKEYTKNVLKGQMVWGFDDQAKPSPD